MTIKLQSLIFNFVGVDEIFGFIAFISKKISTANEAHTFLPFLNWEFSNGITLSKTDDIKIKEK